MKKIGIICLLVLISCGKEKFEPHNYTEVFVDQVYSDSVSIRAITLMDGNLGFAGSKNTYGIYNAAQKSVVTQQMEQDSLAMEFRAVASTNTDFYMLTVASPALLYKTGDQGKMELVYREEHEKVFYDAMEFWNNQEGIAMGDPTDGCLSVIVTRDGGQHWNKLSCDVLPEGVEGEAAFAASDTNIAVVGDHTWIVTGGKKACVFYSPDKAVTWQIFETPIIQGEPTQGIYSVDFYDKDNGFIIGGDYTKPNGNTANKAITSDGGKTWQLVGQGQDPGYRSCVQYLPGRKAEELVAVGFKGISFSNNKGKDWKQISEEPFYTIRFINDSTAFAAGKNRIAKLTFR
ncbi:oxidoreductase [Galbibacter sp. EGI 63066]|uniref:WD40/YVTN/BNR-like repeat-containing protein n=1 Tax=Galbibacter sp. EGI 63066 TaxID=2993559 RepID=UPI00224974C4|nr:oxidoreductase [Galbibacter sp. EGI 63066]MCX2678453.1 oxidoreductase [Galbibacter sp. EGI 63066]